MCSSAAENFFHARLVEDERTHPGVAFGRGSFRSGSKPAVRNRLGEAPVRHLVELKAATDLAELLLKQGRVPEAYQHLIARWSNAQAEFIPGSQARRADPRPAPTWYRRRPLERTAVCALGFKSSHSRTSPGSGARYMLWQTVTAWMSAMGETGRGFIVETLQKAGVKHCYGVVGDTLNRIAGSLEKVKSSGCRCGTKKRARSPHRRRRWLRIA